eukprot:372621-Amphidinium_carterae.2
MKRTNSPEAFGTSKSPARTCVRSPDDTGTSSSSSSSSSSSRTYLTNLHFRRRLAVANQDSTSMNMVGNLSRPLIEGRRPAPNLWAAQASQGSGSINHSRYRPRLWASSQGSRCAASKRARSPKNQAIQAADPT